MNDEKYSIVNVYGPNRDFDKEKFLFDLFDVCADIPNDVFYTVAGDFNMYLIELLDNIAGAPHDKRIVQMFNNLLYKCLTTGYTPGPTSILLGLLGVLISFYAMKLCLTGFIHAK